MSERWQIRSCSHLTDGSDTALSGNMAEKLKRPTLSLPRSVLRSRLDPT